MVPAKTDSAGRLGRRFWNPSSSGLTVWAHVALIGSALLLLAYYWWTPKIPFNNGFGWDGVRYAQWVTSLSEDLLSGSMTTYHVKRTLPSFLVSIPAQVLGLPITRDYIVYGFCVGNALSAYLTGLFWLRICTALNLSGSRALLGLVLLLVNYPVLKQSGYSGVLTDLFALAAATAMLDCWIRGRRSGLAIAVLVSMFCWASTSILGSLLLLFPRGTKFSLGSMSRFSVWISRTAGLVVALGGTAACAAIIILQKEGMPVAAWRAYMPLSILIAGTYAYFVARALLGAVSGGKGPPRIKGFRKEMIFIWLALIPGMALVQRCLAPHSFDGSLSLGFLFLGSINRPGLFLVGDFTYYGTMAVLGALFLPSVARSAGNLGLGVLGAVFFCLALNLYPESRMSLNLMPFFLLPLVMALPQDRFTIIQWAFVGFCQLATSKIWLPIVATAADFEGKLQAYPAQYLFASHGPWMANDAFVLQAAAMIGAVVVAVVLFRPIRPTGSFPQRGS
jgi:hypothetical protein